MCVCVDDDDGFWEKNYHLYVASSGTNACENF